MIFRDDGLYLFAFGAAVAFLASLFMFYGS